MNLDTPPISATTNPELRAAFQSIVDALPEIRFWPRNHGEIDYYCANWTLSRALGLEHPLEVFNTVYWAHGIHEASREIFAPDQICVAASDNLPNKGRDRLILTNNARETEILQGFGYENVIPVGSPFIYEPVDPTIERIPGSVIAFPAHSTTGLNIFDPRASKQRGDAHNLDYPSRVAQLKNDFSLVAACIGASDVLRGNWINAFESNGIPWLTGAWIYDRNAHTRLSRIFRSFEYVATNSFGSHIFLALYCGCKVFWNGAGDPGKVEDVDVCAARNLEGYIVQLKKERKDFDDSSANHSALTNYRRQREDFPELFKSWQEVEAHPEIGERALGEAHRLAPEKLAELLGWRLNRTANGWAPTNPEDAIPTSELASALNEAHRNSANEEVLRITSILERRYLPLRFAHLTKAAALLRLGRLAEAREAANREQKIFGTSPEVTGLLEKIERAELELAPPAAQVTDLTPFLQPDPSPNNLDRYLVRSSILRAVKEFSVNLHGTLLDVGCGIMPYRQMLMEAPSRVTRYLGMDIETDIYQANVDLRWDGQTIPLEDNSVDCAMATEVLEHCPDPLTVLTEIRRVLKPGGCFCFTVPYIWPLHDAPWDFYRYTPFALERFLKLAGFADWNLKALGGWNSSLAQMIGLWLKRSPMDPAKRNEMAQKLYPFYQQLIAEDDRPKDVHAGDTMATGWTGTAFVPAEEESTPIPRLQERVCLVRSHASNYSETFIEDHQNHLSENLAVLHGYPYPRFRDDGKSVLSESAEALVRSQPGSDETNEVYRAGLAEYLKREGFDVILLESGLMGAYAYPACERAGIPYVVHFHGADAHVRALVDSLREEFFGFFRSAAAIIGVSQKMVTALAELGASTDRLQLAPYGVHLPAETASPDKVEPIFIAVGRFVEKKAPLKTIQAFARAHAQCPSARLQMVGDGPLLAQAQRAAEQLGVENAVEFLGVRSRAEVSQLMRNARGFLQHSITARDGDSEGLPLAILEAGAHALPVVSTRHAGIPDAVLEGEHGFLVDEGDVDGMAAAILKLAQDPALAARLGKACRERIESGYSRQVSIGRLQTILQESIKAGPKVLEAAKRPLSRAEFEARLPTVQTAQQCLRLANEASRAGLADLEQAILFQAVGFDRNCAEAYLRIATLKLKAKEKGIEAWLCLREAARCIELPPKLKELIQSLEKDPAVRKDPLAEVYLEHTGHRPIEKVARTRRILIFTNLLPPQEMGGYGRTIWEFADLLMKRGHAVSILTADMPHLARRSQDGDNPVEAHAQRTLRLYGDWREGRAITETDEAKIRSIAEHNRSVVTQEIERFKPDAVIAGNIDFISPLPLYEVLRRGLPVLHRLGNAFPGYKPEETPKAPQYCIASCSEWVNTGLRQEGFTPGSFDVLYPGSPLERYYRLITPTFDRLRICFAGLLQPYKGAQVLMKALLILKRMHVPFRCEFAGDTTDPKFVDELKKIALEGEFAANVRFPGFLSKEGLAALYARSNVMVFPSVFEEPFGKSQIEAMSAGLAVVTSGTGGSREIVEDNHNGVVFKSNDPEDLARQLFILQGNPEHWAKLAAQGQAEAFRFTTLNSVLKIEEIFERLDGVKQTG